MSEGLPRGWLMRSPEKRPTVVFLPERFIFLLKICPFGVVMNDLSHSSLSQVFVFHNNKVEDDRLICQ